jgi:hypothetical protein
MTRITGLVLTAAVALGVFLALRFLRDGRRSMLGIIHGVAGATGLALLLFLLRGPPRGVAMGAGSFGAVAATLLAAALTLGLSIPVLFRRAPRLVGLALAAHASLAISGGVLFLAWASLG